jgi:hypothetical protein
MQKHERREKEQNQPIKKQQTILEWDGLITTVSDSALDQTTNSFAELSGLGGKSGRANESSKFGLFAALGSLENVVHAILETIATTTLRILGPLNGQLERGSSNATVDGRATSRRAARARDSTRTFAEKTTNFSTKKQQQQQFEAFSRLALGESSALSGTDLDVVAHAGVALFAS